ncbi:prepilin-type N-terminal cleavage/methylation domain-containing protein [bacterium]|nr:prepilin-type N-terminal cleavage/methylation domain-containing protein [bacterium]
MKIRREEGFSLMELVVVIVVIGIISATLLPFLKANINAYLSVRSGKDLIQSTRIGIERMIAEIRTVQSSNDIDFGLADDIQFDTPSYSNIEYQLNSGAIKRSEGLFGTMSKVIVGVKNFNITYYDEAGSVISPFYWPRNDIRRVKIDITVGDDSHSYELSTQISPRNFYN